VTELKARLWWSFLTLCGAGVVAVLIAAVLVGGGFNTAANAGWTQPAVWLIHRTMISSVKARSTGATPPASFTPADVKAGFKLYDAHCAMCHGGPGVARQPWTAGLEPPPPYLIDAPHRWSRQDLYWIVTNGVKMSAMPAWAGRFTSGQTWDVVAFLEALPYLTASDYAHMREATPRSQPMPTQPAPLPPQLQPKPQG
jgi:mono/diheme cytochrome c family protein